MNLTHPLHADIEGSSVATNLRLAAHGLTRRRTKEQLLVLLLTLGGAAAAAGFRNLPNMSISGSCFAVAVIAGAGALLVGLQLSRARNLARQVAGEMSAILREGREIIGDAFTQTSWAAYSHWRDKTSKFLEIVFGSDAVDLFLSDEDTSAQSLGVVLGWRIAALEDLLRAKDDWEIHADATDLSIAIGERRAYTRAQCIALVDTPAERWAQGDRPLAPVTVRLQDEADGVVEVPQDGEAELFLSLTLRNADSPDLVDAAIVFEVPRRFDLAVCDAEGNPREVGTVTALPRLGTRQWQLVGYRLRGSGASVFFFTVTIRDPDPGDLFKISLRIPGYAPMINYEHVPAAPGGARARA